MAQSVTKMCNSIHFNRFKQLHPQKGLVVIIFTIIIALASTVYLMHVYSPDQFKNNQNEKTLQALASAKQALLAYATEDVTTAYRSPPFLRCEDRNLNGLIDIGDVPYEPKGCNCEDNCSRPGDLPCADKDNLGEAKTACSVTNFRFGRFPWKTLGSDDLRDGTGERLWYAVSNQYISNKRVLPMNSQTPGGISLNNANGELVNNAEIGNGVVAVLVAVQEPLIRYELNGTKTAQIRSSLNVNDPIHYLEVVQNEDNANFGELTKNGFISGIIKVLQNNHPVIISNDIVLPIYQSEVAGLSKTIVLNEVAKALKNDTNILPSPTKTNEPSCEALTEIVEGFCEADTASADGYIPVSKGNDASFAGWQTKNVNSILRGESLHNWFQQNGWRSLVRYQKDAPCLVNEKWCRNVDSQMTIRID